MKFVNVDEVSIPFDNKWKNLAISLSGGADSALLTFILCSMITENQTIHVINHTRMWKTRPWQQWDALRVFDFIKTRYQKINFVFHKNFIAPDIEYGNIGPVLKDEYGKNVSGDNIQQRSFAEYICFYHNIDAYFNAVTRNPRNIKGMVERDIDPTEANKHLEFMIHMNKVVSHPFRFVDKSWIVAQYKKLNIMELFELTRSCEGEFPNITYESYVPNQYVPLCNECFWCQERRWAIEQQ